MKMVRGTVTPTVWEQKSWIALLTNWRHFIQTCWECHSTALRPYTSGYMRTWWEKYGYRQRLLNYDTALRIAANHIDTERLLPSANVYLHGKPWMAAKALAEKLKVKEFRKPSSYLEHIFDCGNCNPRIKEHALCCYHNVFIQFPKKKGTSHTVWNSGSHCLLIQNFLTVTNNFSNKAFT